MYYQECIRTVAGVRPIEAHSPVKIIAVLEIEHPVPVEQQCLVFTHSCTVCVNNSNWFQIYGVTHSYFLFLFFYSKTSSVSIAYRVQVPNSKTAGVKGT